MAEFGERHFDYVIVGGGSAGCALAARLSEPSRNRVALVEAGEDYPPGEEPAELKDSFAATAHSSPRFTWSGLSAAFLPRPGNQPDRRPRRRVGVGGASGEDTRQQPRWHDVRFAPRTRHKPEWPFTVSFGQLMDID